MTAPDLPRAPGSRLLLLGAPGSGKTCLLATALYGTGAGSGLDHGRSAATLFARLLPDWERLGAGRLPPSHGRNGLDLEVWTESGARVTIQERVEAGPVREPGTAVLLVVGCGDPGAELPALPGVPDPETDRVVLTRVDRVAGEEHQVWNGEPGAWKRLLPPPLASRIEALGLPVVPTSAFGYSETTGFPAWLAGEFGQAIPYRIRPREVEVPILGLMRRIAGGGRD